MELWRLWFEMALNSQQAAQKLQHENFRSCASRIYYASYQAVTAVLLYSGIPPPADREAWSHEVTPGLIPEHWQQYIASKDRRNDLEKRLRTLYKLRIVADYTGAGNVDASSIRTAIKDGNFLIKTVVGILPGERNALPCRP